MDAAFSIRSCAVMLVAMESSYRDGGVLAITKFPLRIRTCFENFFEIASEFPLNAALASRS